MQKVICSFCFVFYVYFSWAQNISTNNFQIQKNQILDSISIPINSNKKVTKIRANISYWKLGDYGISHRFVGSDTTLESFITANPIYTNSISNSFLGNLGTPSKSNILIKQVKHPDFLFITPYQNYLKTSENNLFINTTVPFTKLEYHHGGSRKNAENNLSLLHSRNINSFWNIGFSYDLISSKGFYPNQTAKIYAISFFSSYEKKRYKTYFFINKNMVSTKENGGVQADSLIEDTTLNAENILVYFDDMKTKMSNFNLFSSHHYSLFAKRDSLKNKPLTLVYTLKYENIQRKHYENTVDTAYFAQTLVNKSSYIDFMQYNFLENSLHLLWKFRLFQVKSGIIHKNLQYKQPDYYESDSSGILSNTLIKKFNSTSLGIHLENTQKRNLSLHFLGKYYVAGYQKGNINFTGKLKWQNFNNVVNLHTKLTVEKPNYIWHFYEGNHQRWNNNLENEQNLSLNLGYGNLPLNINVGVGLDILKNYVYLDTLANVSQANKELTVFTAFIEGGIKLWKFHFDQKIYCQQSSETDILPLPQISIYSNNYLKSYIFKKAALLYVGMDVRYNSKFFAPAYMPSLGQFYLQNKKKLGGYPYMNIYASLKIKRATIYLMYSHFNETIGNRSYFQALHYPNNPATFKWGLKWKFFD